MRLSQFRKLIREEVRKVYSQSRSKRNLRENRRRRRLFEVTVNPDPNKEISGSAKFSFDRFAAKCPVILSSEYDGEWMDENEDWLDDFAELQNHLYANYTDGTDFGLMIGMGDDVFNAIAIKNPKITQDPVVRKFVKKIMSYGGLEFEKGKF